MTNYIEMTNFIKNDELYRKLCRLRLNSTNFWYESNPSSKSESKFKLPQQFWWISATSSDPKCRLNADFKRFQTKSQLDCISLNYMLGYLHMPH